jgi:hypothetical protein
LVGLRGQFLALQRSDFCQDFTAILNLLTSQFTEQKDGLFKNLTVLGNFCAITGIRRGLESRTCKSTAHTLSWDRDLTLFRKEKEYNS